MAGSVAGKVRWVGRPTAFAFGLAVFVALFLTLASGTAHASTLTVSNTTDSGAGSLRAAIIAANNEAVNPGHDTIAFDIPITGQNCDSTTKVCTITPSTALPIITAPVTIDGYTQGDGTPSDASDDATENTLEQGTDAALKIQLTGSAAGSANGLRIAANGSTVKGLIINNFALDGILLGIPLGNSFCSSDDNSGNNSVVAGNFIGTNPGGTAAGPGNGSAGITVCSDNNTIGGTTPAARNLISGNNGPFGGIIIPGSSSDAQGNRIEGNLIGTNAAGTDDVANLIGIRLDPVAGGNIIGGTAENAGNVISGNTDDGISSFGDLSNNSPGDTIQGNYIGTNAAGTATVPNAGDGISISIANKKTTIGGSAPGAGNVISGNGGNGIILDSMENIVQGNRIGLKADGTGSLGNGNPTFRSGSGILVNASNNTIGGTDAGAGNTIANNAFMGVQVTSNSLNNAILSNSIFSNGRLGIDLVGGFGAVTHNDPGDGDGPGFANRGQNFPEITSASVTGGNATLSGTLNSNTNSSFRLEFFASESCNANVPGFDNEPFGEGRTYIGFTNVSTAGSSIVSFGPLSLGPVPAGQTVFTATATKLDTSTIPATPRETSEFSECRSPAANSAPTATNDNYNANQDTALTVPDGPTDVLANDTDPNGDTLSAIKVSDPSSGTLTLNSNGSFTYTPNAGFTGTDSFTYKANDGTADSNVATVTVNVQPADTTLPTVFSVNPTENQRGVVRTTNITITFSEQMDTNSFNANTIKLVKMGSPPVSIPFTMQTSTDGSGRTVLTLNPFGPTTQKLGKAKTYQVTVEGTNPTGDTFAVMDLAGNEMANDKVWSFRTRRR